MSSRSVKLREVRRAIATQLRSAGFSTSGDTFRRETRDLVHVISLQRSRTSTAETVRFTLNVGVASRRILERDEISPRACKIEECHWQKRAGAFSKERTDLWWELDANEPVQQVVSSLEELLAKEILPALALFVEDQDLVAVWLAGESPGLTETQRLVYVSTLTRALGMRDEAQAALAELKALAATKSIPFVRMHLAELGEDA